MDKFSAQDLKRAVFEKFIETGEEPSIEDIAKFCNIEEKSVRDFVWANYIPDCESDEFDCTYSPTKQALRLIIVKGRPPVYTFKTS